jgi:TRAP-type mannitol/chloroaromatic compound transport system permease large subunit
MEITLIVLPIFAPALQNVDFGPHLGKRGPILFLTWFVIVMSVNLQTSLLTAPFGFTLFYIKGAVPPTIGMGPIYRGIVPVVARQSAGLLLILAFPQIASWLPKSVGFLN